MSDSGPSNSQNPLEGMGDPKKSGNANLIYILYLVGLVVGITSIVGVVMAYLNKDEAPEWLKTHYIFQIHTFWKGIVIGLAAILTTFILIGFLIGLALVVWWVIRCVKGMQAISRNQPVEDPRTWWI